MLLADSLHNSAELRLKRSAADKESIDIGLRDEICAVAGISRAAILDSSGSSDLSRHIIGEP